MAAKKKTKNTKKKKLNSYQRHIKSEIKKGKSFKQAVQSWKKKNTAAKPERKKTTKKSVIKNKKNKGVKQVAKKKKKTSTASKKRKRSNNQKGSIMNNVIIPAAGSVASMGGLHMLDKFVLPRVHKNEHVQTGITAITGVTAATLTSMMSKKKSFKKASTGIALATLVYCGAKTLNMLLEKGAQLAGIKTKSVKSNAFAKKEALKKALRNRNRKSIPANRKKVMTPAQTDRVRIITNPNDNARIA